MISDDLIKKAQDRAYKKVSQLEAESLLSEIGELTHLGNALRLAKTHGQVLRYLPFYGKAGRWMVWNETSWTPDATGEIFRLIAKQNELLKNYAFGVEDKATAKMLTAWAKSCESDNNMRATEHTARSIHPFATTEDWDNKPYLFAVKNGVIDLKTGDLKPPDPADFLTMHSPIIYTKKAEYPLWGKFMFEAFDEDLEVIHYVQKALGYSMTGNNKEQIVFIGYGTGSNGKSTMLRILLKILGDYGHTAARQTFQLNRFNDQTNDIAQLPGKRFVSWSETKVNASLDEEKIKAMTGGENQRARFLNNEFFEFQPILKLWMFFNHKPTARDDSQGFWRRMRVVPFNHVFDGTDKDIDVKLSKELPGILNWLIEGCIMWQHEGLTPLPTMIQEASATYQEESDPLSLWMTTCVTIGDQRSIKASELYKSYFSWARAEGYSDREVLTNTMFGKRISTKFKKIKAEQGLFYIGLDLSKDGLQGSA